VLQSAIRSLVELLTFRLLLLWAVLRVKYYSGQKVSMNKANDSPFGKKFLAWFFVSVVTVFMVSLILPFPISFVASIIVIFALSFIRADIAMKKAGREESRAGIGPSHHPNLVIERRTTYWTQ
jgi:hypothetical protein